MVSLMRLMTKSFWRKKKSIDARDQNNCRLDKLVLPIQDNEMPLLKVNCYDLKASEYSFFVDSEYLEQYKSLGYPHKKLL